MRILLVAMPDSVMIFNYVTRLPNLGLVSLAGSLPGHDVRILDLVLHSPKISGVLGRTLADFKPDLVGLSAMSFQFQTAQRVARFIRRWNPSVPLVVGGYHATIMPEEITADPALPFDFLIRGEGEEAFARLADRLEKREPDFSDLAGLSYKAGDSWRHNPPGPLVDLERLPLPDRTARISRNFHFLGLPMDVVEFSRGCTFQCRFCSIRNMYGTSFRRFPIERIVQDLKRLKELGFRAAFIVDDNVFVDPDHLRRCCRAIIDNGLNDLFYCIQLTAAGIAAHPDIVAEMGRANIRMAFVGFESMVAGNLKNMQKPTNLKINRRAAELLREQGIAIVAGGIFGFPEDTAERLKENSRKLRQLKPDLIYYQYLTPYPRTEIRQELLAAGLVDNPDDFSKYDGFTCNIHTKHLTGRELISIMTKEVMKLYFNPAYIQRNFFVRHFTRPWLASQLKVLKDLAITAVRRDQAMKSLDL